MSEKPEHLGGGEMRCHTDYGALSWLQDELGVTSMYDIGCGRGGQVQEALSLGINAIGVDGDTWGSGKFWGDLPIVVHDYTKGESPLVDAVDLVWSVEFLEHVEEKYINNFMPDLLLGDIVVVTHATPDMPGHHHVNCQEKDYWIDEFAENGLYYSTHLTEQLKVHSTMKKYFIRKNGLVFTR